MCLNYSKDIFSDILNVSVFLFQILSFRKILQLDLNELVLVSIVEVRTLWSKQTRKKRFISAYDSQVTLYHWGNSEQKPGDRNWCRGPGGALHTDLFLMACLDFFLTKISFTSPGMILPVNHLTLPLSITNNENTLQSFYQPMFREIFSQMWAPFLLHNFSLCQVTYIHNLYFVNLITIHMNVKP